MTRLVRIVLLSSALALPLAGCGSVGDALDPGEWFSGDIFGAKKKLPGDRKPVFPEGVPGVAQGIPPDLVKGNQPPPESGFAANDPQSVSSTQRQAAAPPEEYRPAPREKAKPKPKPKPAATAERQPPERAPASVTVRRPQEQQPPQEQQSSGGVQWPEPPPPQRGGGSSGSVQWPDPPPLR